MTAKTMKNRLDEMLNIYKQLEDLGINENVCEEIRNCKRAANNFIKSGTSETGKLKLKEINRYLIYNFTMQPHVESYANLKFIH